MPAFFRNKFFWLGILAVIVLGATGLILSKQAEAKKAAAAAKPFDSPFAAIAAGKIDVEGGVIQVAARTAGVVRDVYVQEGAEVKKGDVLARLEDDELRLSAEENRAAAEQAKADLAASIARRLAAAEDQIASAETGAVRAVRDRAVSVAVAAAGDLLTKQMTEATANALIDSAIGDVSARLN